MSTYLQLRSDIADELLDIGALSVDQIKKSVQRSIAYYSRRQWWFTEAENSFLTAPGQEYYGVSDLSIIPEIICIHSAFIVGGESLLEQTNESVSLLQVFPVSGMPCSYTLVGGRIRLYPIPETVYTVKLFYNAPLAALNADADSNAWTTIAEELIRQASKTRLAADVLHADDMAVRCRTMETMAYDELLAENRRRQPVKSLRSDMGVSSSFNIMTGT
jgi:hypothetical protein